MTRRKPVVLLRCPFTDAKMVVNPEVENPFDGVSVPPTVVAVSIVGFLHVPPNVTRKVTVEWWNGTLGAVKRMTPHATRVTNFINDYAFGDQKCDVEGQVVHIDNGFLHGDPDEFTPYETCDAIAIFSKDPEGFAAAVIEGTKADY